MNARMYSFWNELGIDLNNLGCLMLDVESPFKENLPAWSEYVPKEFHVTVRYGFLPCVTKNHVRAVYGSDDRRPLYREPLFITGTSLFSSQDRNVECIVARIATTKALLELNDDLAVLPNVRTFPYNPHVTLMYAPRGFYKARQDDIMAYLKPDVKVLGLNYGTRLAD